MSQSGLLRSLLFQILTQRPGLIPVVSPTRWEALCLFSKYTKSWNEYELRQMLQCAADKFGVGSKLCFFIDGLDEFCGKHEELIDLLQGLLRNQNMKICVPSRPWVVFQEAFGSVPNLRVQNLTYGDIEHYVTSKFQEHSGFSQLCKREPEFSQGLIKNVVEKSSGVFL
jgi:hypothetical protein